jgi:hypothetical protein
MENRSRSNIDIVSPILEAANGGASKMQIMYKALLSYKQMSEYVKFMTEKGFYIFSQLANFRVDFKDCFDSSSSNCCPFPSQPPGQNHRR